MSHADDREIHEFAPAMWVSDRVGVERAIVDIVTVYCFPLNPRVNRMSWTFELKIAERLCYRLDAEDNGEQDAKNFALAVARLLALECWKREG